METTANGTSLYVEQTGDGYMVPSGGPLGDQMKQYLPEGGPN